MRTCGIRELGKVGSTDALRDSAGMAAKGQKEFELALAVYKQAPKSASLHSQGVTCNHAHRNGISSTTLKHSLRANITLQQHVDPTLQPITAFV